MADHAPRLRVDDDDLDAVLRRGDHARQRLRRRSSRLIDGVVCPGSGATRAAFPRVEVGDAFPFMATGVVAGACSANTSSSSVESQRGGRSRAQPCFSLCRRLNRLNAFVRR